VASAKKELTNATVQAREGLQTSDYGEKYVAFRDLILQYLHEVEPNRVHIHEKKIGPETRVLADCEDDQHTRSCHRDDT
jgi:hypothetical protein